MKSDRIKKLFIIIIIIALIIGAVLLFKNKGDKKASKEEVKITEELNPLFLTLKDGYSTNYNGRDLLFEKDIKYDDLSIGNILLIATTYATNKQYNDAINNNVIKAIEKTYGYSANNFTAFKGEAVRKAIKELFGKEFEDKSSNEEINFNYSFIYIKEHDIYLKMLKQQYTRNQDYSIVTTTVKTTSTKDEITTEIAVAYTYKYNDTITYSKDPQNKNKIYEATKKEDIDKNKLDEFNHYIIKLKKSGDKYVFESITKK